MRESESLYARALRVIPGGVNSPVRAFKAVGGKPVFISRAEGARLWDADGNEYLDFVGSWGPMILGHAHPAVVAAVREQALAGTSYGAPTEKEVALAEMIVAMVPGVEAVRLVNSGTEATMSALRVARAATGRHKVIKFAGCYHGHADSFLVQAGSGLATLSQPSSPGVPPGAARDTLVAEYNDLHSVSGILEQHGDDVAAVIVEPVAGNMGVVPPKPGFLRGLAELTRKHGAVLIFDEVITGFRLGPGGAQELYGVIPDMTTLGKIIGGGLPIGAFGGRRELMELLAPSGPVYQAGTLSGNPLAVSAGLATLKVLADGSAYRRLAQLSELLAAGVESNIKDSGRRITFQSVESMGTLFFAPGPVTGFKQAAECDTGLYARYFHLMLEQGIYLAPSQFEAGFVSLAHTEADIERFLESQGKALKTLFHT